MSMNAAGDGAGTGEHASFRQGDFQVTILSDGFITIPEDILLHDAPSAVRARTLARLDAPNGMIRPKANIPLIQTGIETILIDIGGGHNYQSSDGILEAQLREWGCDPQDITKVVMSHAHPDHIGAMLRRDGSLRFPNAEYLVGAEEWDFWMDPDYLTTMPEPLLAFARGSRRDLGAIADRVKMLRGGDDIVPGLQVVATPGHTPGHLSFELDGDEGLLIAVDVANNEIASFEHPEWRFGYDIDADLGVRTRRQLLDRAAQDGMKMLGFHWAYPGIGYAEKRGGAFAFSPVHHDSLRQRRPSPPTAGVVPEQKLVRSA